jgi:hypothetical protein
VIRRSETCKKSTYPSLTIVCDDLAITSQLIDTINTRFVEEGFSAEKEQGVDGNSYLYIELGMLGTRRRWVLSGGVAISNRNSMCERFASRICCAS